jgi:hypothetical protein
MAREVEKNTLKPRVLTIKGGENNIVQQMTGHRSARNRNAYSGLKGRPI